MYVICMLLAIKIFSRNEVNSIQLDICMREKVNGYVTVFVNWSNILGVYKVHFLHTF